MPGWCWGLALFVRGVAHEHLLARVGPMGLHGCNQGVVVVDSARSLGADCVVELGFGHGHLQPLEL